MNTQTTIGYGASNNTNYKEVLNKIADDIAQYEFDTTIDSTFTRSLLDDGYNGIHYLKKPSEVKAWDEQEEKPFGQLGPRNSWWLDDFFCESKKLYYSIFYTKNEDDTFSVRIQLVPSLDEYQKWKAEKETRSDTSADPNLAIVQAERFKRIAAELNIVSDQLSHSLSRKAYLSVQTEQAAIELKYALVNFRQAILKSEQSEKTDKTSDYKSFIRELHNNSVESIAFNVPANSKFIHSLINDGYTEIAAIGCTQDINGQPLNIDGDPTDTLMLKHIKIDDELGFSIKLTLVGEEIFNVTIWMDHLV